MMAATRHREERSEVDRHIEVMPIRPRFSVLIDLRQAAAGLGQTLESLALQTYPPHEIRRLGGDGAACDSLAELSAGDPQDLTGDFVIVLRPGECLAERALYEFASEVNRDPACDVLYADEDVVAAAGLHVQPFYKPAWSPDYLELFCYLGFPVAVRLDGLRRCFAGWDAYDMLLRMTEATDRVNHVPQVLGHARGEPGPSTSRLQVEQGLAALEGRLERTGRSGSVRPHPTQTTCFAIRPSLADRPTVSVVISTAGKVIHLEDGRRVDLIVNLVKQIRDRTDYSPVEVIVVDNDDLSEEQRTVLEAHEFRRVTSNSRVFNVARKRNLGASVSTGDLLLFLNDDIEVLQPAWLTHMVAHFEKPQLGVLGVKLLDPDRRIQHVGVVLNSGNPDHVLRSFPGDDPGYFHSGCGPRNFLAVTGAAMMTRRDTFARVGGYSEELAVSFNDIDFCLKVRQLGLNVACDSSIELIHLESQSRLPELDGADFSLFSTRWAAAIIRDPFYNELRLTVASPTFSPQGNRRLL